MIKIKTRSVFYTHTAAISALFIIGQFIITLPFISSFYNLVGFILSAVAGGLICLICVPLTAKIIESKNAFIKDFILFAVSVFAAFTLAEAFNTFCYFVSEVLLDESSRFIGVVLFGAVCIYFAFCRQEAILKFSLLGFIYTLAVVLFFILLMLSNLKVQNITLPQNFDISKFIYGFKIPFLSIFVPVLLLGFYQYGATGRIKSGTVTVGVIIGAVILAVCGFSAVMLFGSEFSAALDFPYSAAASSVAIGRLFSRLDALLYFVFFVCCLVRIQVCIFTVRFCLKKIKVNT